MRHLLPFVAVSSGLLLLLSATRVAVRRARAPELASPEDVAPPTVTVLLPVRDEAGNLEACVRTLLTQTASPRLIVIDDESTDGTSHIAADLAARHPRVEVLTSPGLPAGWKGKVHALSLGAGVADGSWLLCTDADTRHHPELLSRALRTARELELDSISVAGFQEAEGLGENLLIPGVFALLDGILGDWRRAAQGESGVANGQFLLVRREALDDVGGFREIRDEALDDVALVARLRGRNHRHGFLRALDHLRVRMYVGFPQAFHGWRRIFGSLVADRPLPWVYRLSVLLLPPVVLLVGLVTGDWGSSLIIWGAGVSSSCIVRLTSRHAPGYGLLYPLDSIALAACLISARVDAKRGRLVSWKGREISLVKRA